MKRITYKGYIIDRDNLNRLYVYNMASPYSEDSDRKYVNASSVKEAKEIIDYIIERS